MYTRGSPLPRVQNAMFTPSVVRAYRIGTSMGTIILSPQEPYKRQAGGASELAYLVVLVAIIIDKFRIQNSAMPWVVMMETEGLTTAPRTPRPGSQIRDKWKRPSR